jgi:hypothetical protein
MSIPPVLEALRAGLRLYSVASTMAPLCVW